MFSLPIYVKHAPSLFPSNFPGRAAYLGTLNMPRLFDRPLPTSAACRISLSEWNIQNWNGSSPHVPSINTAEHALFVADSLFAMMERGPRGQSPRPAFARQLDAHSQWIDRDRYAVSAGPGACSHGHACRRVQARHGRRYFAVRDSRHVVCVARVLEGRGKRSVRVGLLWVLAYGPLRSPRDIVVYVINRHPTAATSVRSTSTISLAPTTCSRGPPPPAFCRRHP